MNHQDFEKYIPSIAGKLACEGVAISNYNVLRIKEILNNTVAPTFCKKVFALYEPEIMQLLPKEPMTDN